MNHRYIMDIVELVRYNHAVRRLYLLALSALPWCDVVKPRGASFDSMRNIFLHLIFVEDRWINYILPGRFEEWITPPFDDFVDFDALERYVRRVHRHTNDYLAKLTPEDLRREVVIPWGDTPDTRITVDTVLGQLVVEDLYHYGELTALLWQMDVEVPYLAWWRYVKYKPPMTP
jgi:uncharacterized damage-inducible protein DinB